MKQDVQYTGFLNVYKEAGFSSHDVVAKLRGMLRQKKIGHMGTLDPDAEGVLPVALGRATKAISLLEDHSKGYDVRLLLGVETDTYDVGGRVTEWVLPHLDEIGCGGENGVTGEIYDNINVFGENGRKPLVMRNQDVDDIPASQLYEKWVTKEVGETARIEEMLGVSEKKVRETILSFQGDTMQLPPMYSAKKVNGKRLYELAREGIVIERKAVPIRIDEISDLKMDLPEVSFHVECSKGTYIRSLCHDIGEKLGCGGCMAGLVRTRAGQFSIASAHRLSEIQDIIDGLTIQDWILSIDHGFLDVPALYVKDDSTKKAKNGNPLSVFDLENSEVAKSDQYRVYVCENKFLGIYQWRGKNLYPRKVFAE